ncbi:MAG: phage holin, partial [Gordonibacter sp.]|uniref:phage holin n=1 Tax=Gordonibacter sp. TaxID=1968902 RepID=UPI002FCA51B5
MNTKKKAIIRIAIAAVAVINAVAAMVGLPQLAIDQAMVEIVYEGVSALLLVGGSTWAAWKNNSITPEAITAD